MGEVIVITSGKGGVGKTTTTANLGSALALAGKKVALVDTDIGLRNLDVVLGLENRIVYDLCDVIEEKCKLRQALIKDKRFKELFLLPAAQTKDKTAINEEQMKGLINRLREDMVRKGEMVNAEDVLEILAIDLIGVVPDDQSIIVSTNKGEPAVTDNKSTAGQAYRDIVKRIMGEDVPFEKKETFLDKIKKILKKSN